MLMNTNNQLMKQQDATYILHEAGGEVRAGKRTNNGCGNNGVE
jgi:hypothetical protein